MIETRRSIIGVKWRLIGLSVLSAVLLPLALPNQIFEYGNTPVGFVCLAPVFLAVALSPSFGFASVLGVLFGAISTGIANYWLMFFQGFSAWTYGATVAGYIGANALLFPVLRGLVVLKPRQRPFVLAVGWAVYEYLKSIGYLGFPWGLVAYPSGDILAMIQFIDVTGVWGLSFLMSLVNAVIAEAALFAYRAAPPWNDRSPVVKGVQSWAGRTGETPRLFARQAAFLGVLLAVVLIYGWYRLGAPTPYDSTARLLLVQQNIDPWIEGKQVRESTAINEDLTLQGIAQSDTHVDLAAWSEGSVPDIYVMPGNKLNPSRNSLTEFARRSGTYTLFGGVTVISFRDQQYWNSASLLTPEGTVADTYGKMHPVPFAENIPFSDSPVVEAFFKNVVGVWNVWTQGNRYTIFRVPLSSGGSLSFGAPICFEDAFSDLCRRFILKGADIWINLTNDYWSKTVSSEVQHFQVAKFRAVENRRVLVRSTNGGVTVVVGPDGRILASLPLFKRKWLLVDVPVYKEPVLTFYTRFGDYFPRVLGGFLFVYLCANVLLAGIRRRAGQAR